MLETFVAYVFCAKFFYKGKTYIQGENASETQAEAIAEGSDLT